MRTARVLLLLLAVRGVVVQAQPSPALNTCDGAVLRENTLNQACSSGTLSQPKSCGNQECASAISSINDTALSSMRTGFTACGNLPEDDGKKSFAVYATYVNYPYLHGLATGCSLAASTVKVTPPALDTCDGAYTRLVDLYTACPTDENGKWTSGTCKNSMCESAIRSIDDATQPKLISGFKDCGRLPDTDWRKEFTVYEEYITFQHLTTVATDCGLPTNSVSLSAPTTEILSSECQKAQERYTALEKACPKDNCGTAACLREISSINDEALYSMTQGFSSCRSLPQPPPTTPKDFDYQYLRDKAAACGGLANTVTLSPCNVCGKGIRMPETSQNIVLDYSVTCGSFDKQLSVYWSDDLNKCNFVELKLIEHRQTCKCPTTRPPTIPQIQAPAPPVTYVVKMTLSLPMSKADFTSDKQALFKKSIAAAAGAGVSEADVTINKIETIPIGRRLLAESIRVGTTIKASNSAAAETMAQVLTADKLNAELSKNSLPRATVLEVPKVSTVSDTTLIANAIQAALESSKVDGGNGKTDEGGIKEKVKDQAVGYIIGGTLGGLVTVATSVCMYFRNKVCGQTGENQQPNATAETHIEASTRPNLNPLQATVGYSTTNDEEELGLAKG